MSEAEPLRIQDFAPQTEDFRREVLEGLRCTPKSIPAKFFYDKRGSELFERICELPEYYLTRTELRIMRGHAAEMSACLGPRCLLVEYGSGSGVKTRILLDHLEEPAGYVPIDISREHLARTAAGLDAAYPDLEVLPVCADYTGDYDLPAPTRRPRHVAVYFPGSTIGNLTPGRARVFLEHVGEVCGKGGGLLIGVDLKKDRATLERAYDDAEGVTAAFNLNLLERINREADGDFRLDAFRHVAFYNEAGGRIEMHLESTRKQDVQVADAIVSLESGERIHTENSYKYAPDEFAALAERAGLRVVACWTDPRRLFSVQYLETDS
jgi:dimethylhistidine N-methyltransferase